MACQSCAERRAAMKVWIAKKADNARRWAAVRAGHAESAADVQATNGQGTQVQTQGSGQAADTGVEHGQQGVADDPSAGASEGRVSVSSVQEAGGRARGAR